LKSIEDTPLLVLCGNIGVNANAGRACTGDNRDPFLSALKEPRFVFVELPSGNTL
jgi:hypothetical protein